MTSTTVLFACVQNAGRSQMAAAVFNSLADPRKATAISAGTRPADRVNPTVVAAMKELEIDLQAARPRLLTPEVAKSATLLVTMGCGDACPFIPGLEVLDWPLPDPHGRPLEEVRAIRDEIARRVHDLITARGWERQD
jgi:arsenate reductase (thioredoxin)